MGLFKSKFDKLERSDVVDAILKLEKESNDISRLIEDSQKEINSLLQKGKTEKSRDLKLLYAKKINALKEERVQLINRSMYLLKNIALLNKLKQAMDDNQFFEKTSKASLGSLLSDQKGLSKFLTKTLNNRNKSEEVLVNADDTFKQFEDLYEPNEAIYGVNEKDDELLAMFEETADFEETELSEEELTPMSQGDTENEQ